MAVKRTSNRPAIGKMQGEIRVGWFSNAHYPDGTPVAYVASIHESGTPRIPARSFMRPTFNEQSQAWKQMLHRGLTKVADGGMTANAMFEQFGAHVAGQIQAKIKSITTPELSEWTVKQKGFGKPLIDSGLMWQSLTYRVD